MEYVPLLNTSDPIVREVKSGKPDVGLFAPTDIETGQPITTLNSKEATRRTWQWLVRHHCVGKLVRNVHDVRSLHDDNANAQFVLYGKNTMILTATKPISKNAEILVNYTNFTSYNPTAILHYNIFEYADLQRALQLLRQKTRIFHVRFHSQFSPNWQKTSGGTKSRPDVTGMECLQDTIMLIKDRNGPYSLNFGEQEMSAAFYNTLTNALKNSNVSFTYISEQIANIERKSLWQEIARQNGLRIQKQYPELNLEVPWIINDSDDSGDSLYPIGFTYDEKMAYINNKSSRLVAHDWKKYDAEEPPTKKRRYAARIRTAFVDLAVATCSQDQIV